MTDRRPLRITRAGVLASIAVFAVAATCVRLGFWQLERRAAKLAINTALAARMDAEPIQLDAAPADTTGLRFRRVAATGVWDGERTIVLPGRAYQGAPGAHVLTPLRLDDGSAVLVNRGWAPAADGATVDSTALAAAGSARVEGLLDAFPGADATLAQRVGRVEATGDFRRVWFAIDEEALRAQFPYRLADATLRALPPTEGRSFPVRLGPPTLDAGPHLGYAIQWFSFAAIAVIGWGAMVLRHASAGGEKAAAPTA